MGGLRGSDMAMDQHSPYTLKVVVGDQTVTPDFQLEPEVTYGTWPPETQMLAIRATFQTIANDLTKAVNETLE